MAENKMYDSAENLGQGKLKVPIGFHKDGAAGGHHVYLAGLYIGFAQDRPGGKIFMSFLPGMIPVNSNYRELRDIEALIRWLATDPSASVEDEG